ncbi:MAG TPA: SDR family oxidoreductase [Alphaproteobacteria bacterium]|nr:SDR family oxidoreductase [Alphaproteobacteria bacterium]
MVFERFGLAGKVAIVTGAGRGVGREMALALARAGADVVVSARTPKELEGTINAVRQVGRRGLAVPVDVTDSGAVNRLVDRVVLDLGSVDILVNNAGGEFGANKPVTSILDQEWEQVLHTNLTGAFYCTRAVGRHMLGRGWGRVINVACVYGVRGSINHAAYAAAKGGLLQFTQALALEWARQGITVNALGLGWFEGQGELATQPETVERLQRAIPGRRLGHPSDLASALVYLASDASRYLTGQTIWLDGGILCR